MISLSVIPNKRLLDFADIFAFYPEFYTVKNVSSFSRAVRRAGKQAYLHLPSAANGEDIKLLENIIAAARPDGLLADNLYGIELGRRADLPVIAGLGLNVYNAAAAKLFGEFIWSKELGVAEIAEAERAGARGGYVFTAGKIDVMYLNHCPVQLNEGVTCASCKGLPGGFYYKDEAGFKFPIRRVNLSKCYFTVENGFTLKSGRRADKEYYNFGGCSDSEIFDIIEGKVTETTRGASVKGVK